MPESRIRPLALYWDGVQYGKKQSFVAMCCHDLRAGKKHLCFLIRAALRPAADQKCYVIMSVFGVDVMRSLCASACVAGSVRARLCVCTRVCGQPRQK